ncbi:MAG: hypothetical protein ACD_34C00076G0003 [uncultured bacterium]|nr:MAG: hypothetical protein ACD_34C00076G0003 [uncultured bacterium]
MEKLFVQPMGRFGNHHQITYVVPNAQNVHPNQSESVASKKTTANLELTHSTSVVIGVDSNAGQQAC